MKPKVESGVARAVATKYAALLKPICERIEIVGSLRRKRPTVSDVEILYIPKFQTVQVDFFSSREEDLVSGYLETMLSANMLAKRLNKLGSPTWGSQNKLAVDVESGINVDFFSTNAERWYVALVVRTGSADFNVRRLIPTAARNGVKIHAYGVIECDNLDGRVAPRSEQEVLSLCGLPWIPPEKRF